jgi:molecular chaperone GrpE
MNKNKKDKKKPQEQQEVKKEEQKKQEEVQEDIKVETKEDNSKQDDELAKCKEELENYKDKYLRAHADFENSKKRLEREKQTALTYANESFAIDLLSVLDTFENAIASIEKIDSANEESLEKIKEGMILTYEQLLSVLKKHGVEEVACEGEFDHNLHQVVMQEESSEHKSGEIVKVLQKGYKLKDRLLRAAMVTTCK